MRQREPGDQPRTREQALGILGLLLLTLVAFWPATRAGFIWDDDDYVTNNQTLRSAHGLKEIWFTPGAVPQYYPMVHTSFWVEYHLWRLRPAGYHVVNILLHALAAALAWFALRRLAFPGAWLAAALFAVHPVQVESVAWVTERKNVLSAVFYFAAAVAYLRFPSHENARTEDATHPRLWYATAFLLFLFALWSKTVAASFPVAVLIAFWYDRGRLTRRDAVRLVPFFAAGILMAMVTVWMERSHVRAQGPEWDLSVLERFGIAGRAFWFYLGKLVLPMKLTFIYRRWSMDGAVWHSLFPLGVVLLSATLWIFRGRTGRGPIAAALFFAVTLFPALGFINTFPMRYSFVADHFQYMAALGPLALLAAGIARLERLGRERAGTRVPGSGPADGITPPDRTAPPDRIMPARVPLARITLDRVVPALVLGIFVALTWHRAGAYRDPEALWLDTIEKNPAAWMAHHNLGKLYEEQGRVPQAIEQYKAALLIRPDLDTPYFNLANLYANQSRLDEAVASYEAAVRINPNFVEARNNLGNTLYKMGRGEAAIAAYRAAVSLDPTYASAQRNLAFALADQGNLPEAIERYRTVLRLDPTDHASMNRLAWLLATAPDPQRNGTSAVGSPVPHSDPGEAVAWAQRACEATSFQMPSYIATLAAAYAAGGQFDSAASTLERAINLARAAGKGALAAHWEEQLQAYRDRTGSPTGPAR